MASWSPSAEVLAYYWVRTRYRRPRPAHIGKPLASRNVIVSEPFLISRTSSTSRPWTMLVAPITSVLFGRFERRERLTEQAIGFARHLRQCQVLTDDAERGKRGHRCNDARRRACLVDDHVAR